MKTMPLDLATVDRLVQVHVGMYTSGVGEAGVQGEGPGSGSSISSSVTMANGNDSLS